MATRSEVLALRQRRWATKAQTAEHLRCGVRTVDRMIAAGEITAYRVHSRSIRLDLNEVDASLAKVRTIAAVGGDAA